jgi:8-oxo-dGTP diphosphatase
MLQRPSARLIILDDHDRVLLFRFVHRKGALAGQQYWATPGGALEPGESYEEAARRELFEETGLEIDSAGPPIAERQVVLTLESGERAFAIERFFLVRSPTGAVSRERWTPQETEVMADHRWWSTIELAATTDTVFPENLADLVTGLR